MTAMVRAGYEGFPPDALVIDCSDLKYEWGDEMTGVLCVGQDYYVNAEFPTTVVVSDRCRDGLTSLVRDELDKDPKQWLFESLREAIDAAQAKYQLILNKSATRPTISSDQEALDRIAKTKATHKKSLILGDLDLERLPREIADLSDLRELHVGRHLVSRNSSDLIDWEYHFDEPGYPPRLGPQPLRDISVVAELIELESLNFSKCENLSDLSPVAGLKKLKKFHLSTSKELRDLTPLAALPVLEELRLNASRTLRDFSPLARLTSLKTLSLAACPHLTDLSPLAKLASLTWLDLAKCQSLSDLTPLAQLTNLEMLYLMECSNVRDISPLRGLTGLVGLDLRTCGSLIDLAPLNHLPSLQWLFLGECEIAPDLSDLVGLTSLRDLYLMRCQKLNDLAPLAGLPALRTLNLSECGELTDLTPLVGCKSLRELNLSQCRSLRMFEPLRALVPQLDSLQLYGCPWADLPRFFTENCGNVIDRLRMYLVDPKVTDLWEEEIGDGDN